MSSALRTASVLLVGAVMLAGCAPVPRTTSDGPLAISVERERLAELSLRSDEAVADHVPASEPGCSAAVGVRGAVLWAGAGGLADLSTGTPVTTQTRFDIASLSKQFTATAVLMLQREGLLALSDPVAMYVDDLPEWGQTVTLTQLIHHTSRIPDYWVELAEVGIGFSQFADQFQTMEAIRREDELEPGEGFLYSNSNYILLAEVVARVSGQTLPEFLAERIFAPLQLDMVVQPTVLAPDIALSYDDKLQVHQLGWTSYGHSGIVTTPSELARWGDQYRDGDIIQEDFASGTVYEAEGEYYAAGMDIEVDGDLNHTGRMGGFVSEFTISADRETTIAVICNGQLSDRFGLADALWAIWDPK